MLNLYGWGLPLLLGGVCALMIGLGYRRVRQKVERAPLSEHQSESLRQDLGLYTAGWRGYRRLIRLKSGRSELEFIQADPSYGLRRERTFVALSVVLILAGLVLLWI